MKRKKELLLGLFLCFAVAAFLILTPEPFASFIVNIEVKTIYAIKGHPGVSGYCGMGRITRGPVLGENIISRLGVPFRCHTVFALYPKWDSPDSADYVGLFRYADEETARLGPMFFVDEDWVTLAIYKGREY
ncbi:hypothetical protein A3H65_04180 [Candidatus Giovannonibacteria bacterium RIFCSPLOWO2_02_FULL_45_14]|uniref:Uncharacterized protein n=1 Tax=Candidatus Giovannonibacteria bacterium RIFCSPLOWO2_12_FULL_44_15 TaxID=1798364 RepID=A0A1F5Y0U4_9BACT|nr:MAG: hypothetical protein A3C75_02375 [Candidatus Giovannonibacteria bacterium RIFCSPHIGHO2_02_FULL_44_31]OGF76189.1 MAG: hypothetical protein A3E62_01890 [Candidatus Giovannonibacteria bacterium RIFCSPHIGHO2_12_FULL_44_29]OGF91030.1 MAG: hypothetical protein A3H65_04180 [Candidatus Giovannonibacteria bacterium RIFCSPLOWO2_02_FULL_45_14]OGF93471.1 MAG: hypothetical protein A3G54_00950 [Candidatus Giovannonibacteria bacterium RIFCSPLOWO2_12_FULL_44_15]